MVKLKMVTKSRRSGHPNAATSRNTAARRKPSVKLPLSKSINMRVSQRARSYAQTRKSAVTVHRTGGPSTSGRSHAKKLVKQSLQYDITAIDIAPENRRPVIIDGENVAYNHVSQQFHHEQLLSAIQWFQAIGHTVLVLCPAYMVEKIPFLRDAVRAGNVELVDNCPSNPEKNYTFEIALLEKAKQQQAAIVSERLFSNSYGNYSEIVTQRVIGYTLFAKDIFIPVDPYGRSGPWLKTILQKKT